MTVPSSSDLYEAGLVSGVTYVAEFWNMGLLCMAIPNDFYVRKPPGSRVKCVWSGRETTLDELAAWLEKRRCVLVVMPRSMQVANAVTTWLPTTANLLSP